MIVLDTNVVSEFLKPAPDSSVVRWLASQSAAGLFLSTITEAELRLGVALLPAGRRRDGLAIQIEAVVGVDFAGRMLPFDGPAAREYAVLAALRRRAGRPMSQSDAQIAAIAKSRGAPIATRNITDFAGCGVEVIDPWGG